MLILLALALFLPGIKTLPALDRDEPRFAQASKQMIESGNYLDIYFQQEPRYKKPVGIYWLQSLSAKLFGAPPYEIIWPYRLPSLFGGILALCLMAWGVGRLSSPQTGLLAAIILASTVQLHFESRIAKTDAVLLACITGVQLILAQAYCGKIRSLLAYGFWFCMAVAIIIKGPIAPLISGLTILALWLADRQARWLRQLRPLSGLILCVALVAPWLIWIGINSQGKFYGESVIHDLLGKILQGQDRGFLPPGYHTLLLPLLFLPQIVAALFGLRSAWRDKHEKPQRFALAWIIPTWLLYELISTKLPHYVLPCYPALAWLAATYAPRLAEATGRGWLIVLRSQTAALCIGLLIMVFAPFFLQGFSLPALLLGSIGIICAMRQMQLFHTQPIASVWHGFAAGSALFIGMAGIVLPQTTPYWLTPQITAIYNANRPCPFLSSLVTSGYNEPSLVFMTGTRTLFANGADYAADQLTADACAVALIRDRQQQAFEEKLRINNTTVIALGEVSGFNYNGGGWQNYTLYRRLPTRWQADAWLGTALWHPIQPLRLWPS